MRVCVRVCVFVRVFLCVSLFELEREREGKREGGREGERERERTRGREGGRKLGCVCGLVRSTFYADPHLKHILRHSLGERAQLEGNAVVLARGEEVVERPLPQLPALCKLLLTNVGHCRLLTPGRDACLRHRHAVLCGFSAYLQLQ